MSLTDQTPMASVHTRPLQLSTPPRRQTSGLRSGQWRGRQAWWPVNSRHPDQAIISGGTLHLERARHGDRNDQGDISALHVQASGQLLMRGQHLMLRQDEHLTPLSELITVLRRHLCESSLHVVLQQQGRLTYFAVDIPTGRTEAVIRSGRGPLSELASLNEPADIHLIVGACPAQMSEVTDLLRREWKRERNRAQRAGQKASRQARAGQDEHTHTVCPPITQEPRPSAIKAGA